MTRPGFVREPKQERSRQSFDRAVDAALALLAERRSASFTLADVATRSGVSTGSIYARVAGKDDLIRVAHARLMAQLSEETAVAFRTPPSGGDLAEVVGQAVALLAELLRRHADALAPFMLLADGDAVIAQAGSQAHEEMVDAFTSFLLGAGPAIVHPDPDKAATWSCTVVYSVLARRLGLGTAPDAVTDQPWDELLEELTEMLTAYLGRR